MSPLLLVRVTSCVGPVPTSLVTSPVPVFWSVLMVTLGIVSGVRLAVGLCSCAPDADELPQVTEVCGGDFVVCPAQFSSEALTRDDERH